jgi:hypothetical protein
LTKKHKNEPSLCESIRTVSFRLWILKNGNALFLQIDGKVNHKLAVRNTGLYGIVNMIQNHHTNEKGIFRRIVGIQKRLLDHSAALARVIGTAIPMERIMIICCRAETIKTEVGGV